jgi:serine/threonine protein kinase/tetratricopeptide (TPR) repeat protein
MNQVDPVRWARIKEVFHAALERPDGERSSYVAMVCGEDPNLRAEVERLLIAHRQASGFIERSPVGVPDQDRGLDSGSRSRLPLTGQLVGRYEVGRLIGAGGMGEVYAARDTELGREVALKIGSDTDAEAQVRLRREAQHASQLNHPHICTIHEVGTFDDQPYIVMELVEGERLSDVIPRDGLDIERALRYSTQIADGLAHAHQHGVSHRDLKSENIVVTPEGRAKILDFGLARRLAPGQLKQLSESRATFSTAGEGGAVAGTLSAMAPELLRGEQADQRSDIWALGVLLYEMVAGARPFSGATAFELTGSILHEPPPSLPARVPSSLQAIIRRCLAKDPRERYPAADEVLTALEAVRTPQQMPRRERIGVRSWRTAAAALALVIALAGGMALWLRNLPVEASVAVGASGRPAIAIMQFENVTGTQEVAWMSRGVPNMLLTGLAQTRGLDIVSGQRLLEVIRQTGRDSLESLDRTQIADVARRAGAGAVVVGSIVKAGSEIRIDAQLEDLSSGRVLAADSVRGTDLFALVDQLAARIRDGVGFREAGTMRHVADVSTSSLEAYRLYSEGLTAYANTRAQDARELFEKAVAIDPAFAQAYIRLALVSGHMSRTSDVERFTAKAAQHADRLDERHQLLLQAEVARNAGRFGDAVQALDEVIANYPDLEEAYAIGCRLYTPGSGPLQSPQKYLAVAEAGVAAVPSSTLLLNFYGYALLHVGRYDEAIRVFESYAKRAPREPNPYDSLGEAHMVMGLPERAIEYYSRALTIHPTFFPSHLGRAWAASMVGRFDDALAEPPARGFVTAFILSRVGRYREAAELIVRDTGQAEANGNVGDLGMLHLVSSVLALERKQPSVAAGHVQTAERHFAQLPAELRRLPSVLASTLAGLAELQAGQADRARVRLDSLRRVVKTEVEPENWWYRLLEGEIELAAGDARKAAAAFAAGEPRGKMWLHLNPAHAPLLANNLPYRDGPARAAKAQGDLAGAIGIYRSLLTPGQKQKWTAMYEPRYVLEIARLLEQSEDKRAALKEYERFLEFWQSADRDLPELAEARAALARLRT